MTKFNFALSDKVNDFLSIRQKNYSFRCTITIHQNLNKTIIFYLIILSLKFPIINNTRKTNKYYLIYFNSNEETLYIVKK